VRATRTREDTTGTVFENGEPVFGLSGPLALIVKEAKRKQFEPTASELA
jgi:hypothetical protein